MATKKKMLEAAAGGAGGAGLDITDVFSTYLYTGTHSSSGSPQAITNGIDLAGEGGMVWVKGRAFGAVTGTAYHNHFIDDTERGAGNLLSPNLTDAAGTISSGVDAFNSDGFDAGFRINISGGDFDYASWTFRKAPKFFTMVQWSGNSTMGRTISHDLGADVGFILIKSTTRADAWYALHKDSNMLVLNQTSAAYNDATTADYFGDGTNIVRPTSTEFTIGQDAGINGTGESYIAYLFSHNNSDGEFGPDGDQDIIKCGSYTGNGSTNGPEIDLGFEPQWLMIKRSDSGDGWPMIDSMRGFTADGSVEQFSANNSDAGAARTDRASPTAAGFKLRATDNEWNASGGNYIYMAIRRGPLAPPEAATEVFAIDASPNSSFPVYEAGFPVDFGIRRYNYPASGNSFVAADRLRGATRLITNLTNAEASTTDVAFDSQVGWWTQPENSTSISWMWKRAPSYFDAVCYTGTGSNRTVSHNLTVAPEMMWIKCRSAAESWAVYHAGITNPEQNYLYLDESSALNPNANTIKYWNNTNPTDSVFTVGIEDRVNGSAKTYIAYLFASLPGISKVGSVSHVQYTDTNVDCGFTSGARFVLLKRTNTTGDWWVFDTTRGIAAGDDKILFLNSTAAEFPNDSMSPLAGGFTMVGAGNETGDYIFYAIA